jgi:CspA family cold shock protein
MMYGTVKSFKPERGWGFIIPDGGGRDIFVHARELNGMTLAQGQRVGFLVKSNGSKGDRAINVIVLLGDQQPSRDQPSSEA